jgi:hypothetical protein
MILFDRKFYWLPRIPFSTDPTAYVTRPEDGFSSEFHMVGLFPADLSPLDNLVTASSGGRTLALDIRKLGMSESSESSTDWRAGPMCLGNSFTRLGPLPLLTLLVGLFPKSPKRITAQPSLKEVLTGRRCRVLGRT